MKENGHAEMLERIVVVAPLSRVSGSSAWARAQFGMAA